MQGIRSIPANPLFKTLEQTSSHLRQPSPSSSKTGSSNVIKTFTITPRGEQQSRHFTAETIEPSNQKDTTQVKDIYVKSILANKQGFSWKTHPIQEIQNILHSSPDSRFFILRDENKDICAFAGLKKPTIFHDEQKKPIHTADEMEVAMLHADRDRSKGCSLGKQLLKTLADYMENKGKKTLVLHVTSTQKHASRLYENVGFKSDERFVENPKNYVVPLGDLASVFKGTSIEQDHQHIQKTANQRSFPTLHLKADAKVLGKLLT